MNWGRGIFRPLTDENIPSFANSTQRYARAIVRHYRARMMPYVIRHGTNQSVIHRLRSRISNLTDQLDREQLGQVQSVVDDIIQQIEKNERDLIIHHVETNENVN